MNTATDENALHTFTVWSDSIRDRLDCSYHFHQSFFRVSKFSAAALGSLLSEPPQYGANEQAVACESDMDVRYIRITDIDEYGNLRPEAVTAKRVEKKYLLKDGDILFARSGATAGKCFLYKDQYPEAIFAGYLIRFRVNSKFVLPKYVFYYCQTSMYAQWVKTIIRPSGQPNINSEEFKALEIPLPSPEFQQKIVDIMEVAYHEKQEKESHAQSLLDSIDEYLLGELGIKLPDTGQQITFTVWSDELEGKIDPRSYSVRNPFGSTSFPLAPLKDHILINPSKSSLEELESYTFVPMGSVSEESLSITDHLEIEAKQAKGYTPFKEGDLIVAKITPCMENGKMAVAINLPIASAYGSTEFHVFRESDKSLSVEFLLELFHLSAFRAYAQANFSGSAGQQRVSPDFFDKLSVPMPPKEIQAAIANEAKRRREEARRLREEAAQVLNAAKAKVEQMILGEE